MPASASSARCDGTHVVTIEHLSRGQRAAASGAAGDGGFSRQPVRVLHAGHRDVALWAVDAASRSRAQPTIEKALQGNLCRCTGYSPIIRAAKAISSYGAVGERSAGGASARRSRRGSRRCTTASASISATGKDRLIVPASVDDLAEIYAAQPDGDAGVRRDGCRAVGHQVHARYRADDLSSAQLPGAARDRRGRRRADASAPASPIPRRRQTMARHFPQLVELWDRIGGEQVRNVGTIGANIANGSPIGDTPPPLIALGAHGDAAQGQRAARGAARGLLHRLWQAGPAARRVRRERHDARCCRRANSSPATRSPSARTRIFRRCAARSG